MIRGNNTDVLWEETQKKVKDSGILDRNVSESLIKVVDIIANDIADRSAISVELTSSQVSFSFSSNIFIPNGMPNTQVIELTPKKGITVSDLQTIMAHLFLDILDGNWSDNSYRDVMDRIKLDSQYLTGLVGETTDSLLNIEIPIGTEHTNDMNEFMNTLVISDLGSYVDYVFNTVSGPRTKHKINSLRNLSIRYTITKNYDFI